MKATCILDAHAESPIEGTVSEISPVAREPSPKSQRRSFQVTIALAQANHEPLLPGLSVKVDIQGRQAQGVLRAPRVALDFEAKPARLRTATAGLVDVDVGLCDAQQCEVRPHGEAATSVLAPGLRLRAAGAGE
jgi:hypothetical protein